jgi:hypothetical protein
MLTIDLGFFFSASVLALNLLSSRAMTSFWNFPDEEEDLSEEWWQLQVTTVRFSGRGNRTVTLNRSARQELLYLQVLSE